MSLITRCPTCETMFRVVPDQLRVSEGWVRCGHCAEVFDATQNMVPPPDAATAGAQPDAASPATATTSTTGEAGTVVPAAPGGPAGATPVAQRAESPDAAREASWLNAPETDPQSVFQPTGEPEPDAIELPMPALRNAAATDLPVPAADAGDFGSGPRHAGIDPTPSFLQDEPPPSVWRRPVVRLLLAVLLVLLLALLAMQYLVKERDRVAAMQPAVRPVLQAICAVADCSIGPLRQIESIVIDSSSFSRLRGDDYQLGFALKNTAPIDVAMPAIELSLTDPQDQPVVRRVILPSEFGARSAALAGTAVWTGSLTLTVQPDIGAQRIAGYRLLAFYP